MSGRYGPGVDLEDLSLGLLDEEWVGWMLMWPGGTREGIQRVDRQRLLNFIEMDAYARYGNPNFRPKGRIPPIYIDDYCKFMGITPPWQVSDEGPAPDNKPSGINLDGALHFVWHLALLLSKKQANLGKGEGDNRTPNASAIGKAMELNGSKSKDTFSTYVTEAKKRLSDS